MYSELNNLQKVDMLLNPTNQANNQLNFGLFL